jgi:hypothetical protein
LKNGLLYHLQKIFFTKIKFSSLSNFITLPPFALSMSEAFDAAWSVLKALPEQQMFVEASPRHNAAVDAYDEYKEYPMIDERGARSLGTVHPAIQSMLRRRRNPDGTRRDKYLYGDRPANLNLDMGRDDAYRMAQLDRQGKQINPYAIGRSIAQGPEYNKRMYDDQRHTDYISGKTDTPHGY